MSDNASTYEAAAKEVEQLINSDALGESLCTLGVRWKFIPKRAPWYGGFWERLIGLTKTTLRKVLGRAFVTLPALQTLIVEIEAVLNDRPLTYVSTDLDDPNPLTPSHLLCGRRITSLPHKIVEDDPTYGVLPVREIAQRQNELLRHFEKRWKREYLTSLRDYHRTTGNNQQDIKVGDVVTVYDDVPRINWKLAVVEQLITGMDGYTRVAEIRTATGKTNRPIARLYPLEVNEGSLDPSVSDNQATRTNKTTADLANHQKDRPTRQATIAARRRLKEWSDMIRAAPEDVTDYQ